MSVDPKILEAVKAAVAAAEQPPALARRLVAWLEAVGDESEDINDVAATDRRLEIIYEAVDLSTEVVDEASEDDVDEEEA